MGNLHWQTQTLWRERKHIQEHIKTYGYQLCDIFNMDETGLFWGCIPISCVLDLYLTPKCRLIPDRGLSDHKQSGVKGKDLRLTYAFTTNVDGSEKLPAFIIGKAA